ncbi:MAG: polyphosphate polymerase domain-containing protein [Lachnospiraceae bacterium]|nr:polyphosphate polymerase domain-containing protein [Lachnospiraceae bacterium]
MKFNETFNRVEMKYVLSEEQYQAFMNLIRDRITEDAYFYSNILNIYYDTDSYEVIRHSIEKPKYKEKLRLRSYGVPTMDSTVFVEIKKKFDGRVYKRRIALPLREAKAYLDHGIKPTTPVNPQILKEIDFFLKRNPVKGQMFVAYDREAYVGKDDNGLRITIDENLRNRESGVELEKGMEGKQLFDDNRRVVEIKCLGAYPRWLVEALNSLKIYPASFSKYGSFYKQMVIRNKANDLSKANKYNDKGAIVCLPA